MSAPEQGLIEKIRKLPPQRLAEVEDFVDFLRTRDTERQLIGTAVYTAQPSFRKIWDNPEDADYDRL